MKKYFYSRAVILLAVVCFTLCAWAPPPATQRFVSLSGNDISGDGSFANPWLTIQHAVDNSNGGDFINIMPGTYISSNVTVNKPLTIRSIYGFPCSGGRNSVVIVPAAEDGNQDNAFGNNAQNAFIIKSDNVTIEDLTINGRGNPALTHGKNNFRAGIVTAELVLKYGVGLNNLHVNNVFIKYTWRRGISVYTNSISGTVITGTRVENVAYNQGMYLAGQSQVINDTVRHCFQGIVQNPDASTPGGLILATGNFMSDIENFPGCWGDEGHGLFSGQPRGLEFNNTDSPERKIVYSRNTMNDFGEGAVGIYTVRADENSRVDSNTICFLWDRTQGMLLGWSYNHGFKVSGNTVTVAFRSRGIYIFGSGTVGHPITLEKNTVTGILSFYLNPGDGTGIVISNHYLNGPDEYESNVVMQNGNSISGFMRGIDVIDNSSVKSTNGGPALALDAEHNSIFNNHPWGLCNNTGVVVTATNNWWGSCTGPYHPLLNPTGRGNAVSDNVNFIPWESLPEAAGPISGPDVAYQGQSWIEYSIDPIPNATGYVWTLPPGAYIQYGANTNKIRVYFSMTASSGLMTVTGENSCGSGDPSQKSITVKPPLPYNLNVQNEDIKNGDIICYDATNIITLAGNGSTFTVESGGSAEVIAGKKIRILPTSKVFSGGYFHAYITTDNLYCGQEPTKSGKDSTGFNNGEVAASAGFFKAYPNPTRDKVTIELNADEKVANAVITVYSMMGNHALQQPMNGSLKTELYFGDLSTGIYLVRVVKDDKTGTVKVIKQ